MQLGEQTTLAYTRFTGKKSKTPIALRGGGYYLFEPPKLLVAADEDWRNNRLEHRPDYCSIRSVIAQAL